MGEVNMVMVLKLSYGFNLTLYNANSTIRRGKKNKERSLQVLLGGQGR